MPVIEGGQVLRGGQDFGGVLGGQVLYGGQEIEAEQGGRTQPDSEAVEMSVGPFRYSGAPPNGWYDGVADKGAIAVDVTTGTHYTNTGTKAATVWTADAPSGGGSASVIAAEVTFTETAGAGTYTGTITVPAGATILDVMVTSVAQWAADTAGLVVGDAGNAGGFFGSFGAMDLKTSTVGTTQKITAGAADAGAYVGNNSTTALYSASSHAVVAQVTTTGASGTTGRTRVVVLYALATPTAATKA